MQGCMWEVAVVAAEAGFWLNQLDRILAEEKPGDQTSQERW